MTLCTICGVEIPHATSNQKYCKECREKIDNKNKGKPNEGLSRDLERAMSFKMTYGEYRQFCDKLKKIK